MLSELVLFMARRVAGDGVEDLAGEAEEWILANLGPAYPWPGNYRELEQCVRNLIIRRDYRPAVRTGRKREAEFLAEALEGALTADELLSRYCTLVYHHTGSYQEAARRLQLDR